MKNKTLTQPLDILLYGVFWFRPAESPWNQENTCRFVERNVVVQGIIDEKVSFSITSDMVNGATTRRFLFLVFKYSNPTLSSMNAHYFPFNGQLHHPAPQNLAESTARQHMCVSLSSSARHVKHMLLFMLTPTSKANPNWLGSIRLYIHSDFQDWLHQQPAAASSLSEFSCAVCGCFNAMLFVVFWHESLRPTRTVHALFGYIVLGLMLLQAGCVLRCCEMWPVAKLGIRYDMNDWQ